MEKKVYQKPTMKVYEVKMSQIICASGDNPGGYIPGIPGIGTDMNRLA